MNESLEEDRDYLLRSLEDLEQEREAGDIEEADYLTLKEDYTARAADVLRSLAPVAHTTCNGDETASGGHGAAGTGDGLATEGSSADGPAAESAADVLAADGNGDGRAADAAGVGLGSVASGTSKGTGRQRGVTVVVPARRAPWRPVLVVGALLALAVGAGALVARSAGQRLPGGAASGAIAATGPSAGIADDLARARDFIGAGKTLDAIKLYDAVIKRDPTQPEALAYRGWLLRLAGRAAGNTGLIDRGMESIERAVAADPTYPDAHFFRAFVLYQDRNDPAAAVPELRTFLASNPPREMVPVVEDLLQRALVESEGAAPTPADASTTAPPG